MNIPMQMISTTFYSTMMLILNVTLASTDLLSQIAWDNGKFFKTGCPMLKEGHIFNGAKDYTVTPTFFVVKSSLEEEGNLYISLGDIREIKFRFYGEKHPDYRNYMFDVNSTQMNKCENLKNCEALDICELGKNENVTNNQTIFTSWKMMEKTNNRHYVILLFQYKDLIVKCIDFNGFKIKKIVLQGKNPQQVKSKSGRFKYTTTNKPEAIVKIPKNTSSLVAVYATSCWNCKFSFNLSCGSNFSIGESKIHYDSSQLIKFSGNEIPSYAYPKWEKIILNVDRPENICTLNISGESQEESKDPTFWAIAFIDPHEKEQPNLTKTTVTTTTTASTTSARAQSSDTKSTPRSDCNCNPENSSGILHRQCRDFCFVSFVISIVIGIVVSPEVHKKNFYL